MGGFFLFIYISNNPCVSGILIIDRNADQISPLADKLGSEIQLQLTFGQTK